MKTIALSLALALCATPSIAYAESSENQIRVEFSDLDITSAAGKSVLQARLKSAVKRVCQPLRLHYAGSWAKYKECVAETTQRTNMVRDAIIAQRLAAMKDPQTEG